MIRLVANNPHGNGISVFYDKRKNVFYKVASSVRAVSGLRNEKNGWDWYLTNILRTEKLPRLVEKDNEYARLEISKFYGEKISYTQKPENTIKRVDYFINYYLSCWPRNQQHSYHGDLTLSNIIWGDIPYVIDWEQYGNRKIFWGFDVIYLLLSIIILPYENFTIPSKNILKKLGMIFVKLEKNGVDKKILEQPAAEVKKAIKNIILPRANCEKTKFFLLKFSELEVDILDECLVRAYRYAVYDEYLETFKEK